jgi:hypothetical protein
MKNIHLLKTTNTSKILKDLVDKTYQFKKEATFGNRIELPLNIYITSDEEIRDLRPHKGKWHLEKEQILNKFPDYLTDLSECKLIILTTDQDLIKDGVQAIDDEFLEWFVKNPSCEEVKVDLLPYGGTKSISKYWSGEYKIIIPKEEPNGCIGINGVSDPKLNEVQLNQSKQETINPADFMQLGEKAFEENVHEKLRETLSPNEKQMWISGYLLALTQQNKK